MLRASQDGDVGRSEKDLLTRPRDSVCLSSMDCWLGKIGKLQHMLALHSVQVWLEIPVDGEAVDSATP
jgi:hypothetical protein